MKILLLSSHTPTLFIFRLDLMKAFVAKGCEVVAAAQMPEKDWVERFNAIGVKYRQINVSRNGLNPFRDIETLKSISHLIKEEHPDKVFTYQAKTISYGCKAANRAGITEVYTLIAGIGSILRGKGLKNTVIKIIVAHLYKSAFKKSKVVFLQNEDDKQLLMKMNLLQEKKVVKINGSGVNLKAFEHKPLPCVPTFLFVGRLIRDKGVGEYLGACKSIKEKYGNNVRCLLVGPFDTNPSAIHESDITPLAQSGIIEYFGEQTDVRPFLEQCSVFVLPSYHEGTPKSVLEAMATGRAIITTDAPGCRETVTDNVNGFLVPVKDVDSIVSKMEVFINDFELTQKMGKESRRIAELKFDVDKVNDVILKTMGI